MFIASRYLQELIALMVPSVCPLVLMNSTNINIKVEHWWNDIYTSQRKPFPFPIAILLFKSHMDWSVIETGPRR